MYLTGKSPVAWDYWSANSLCFLMIYHTPVLVDYFFQKMILIDKKCHLSLWTKNPKYSITRKIVNIQFCIFLKIALFKLSWDVSRNVSQSNTNAYLKITQHSASHEFLNLFCTIIGPLFWEWASPTFTLPLLPSHCNLLPPSSPPFSTCKSLQFRP